ncbi:hypothetical protein HBH56_020520 [Parastagonospora nodorum]|uniref:Uncharacterized protein n=1 Tax=Phaeosphaeria nodorum (strain SN15 / ATCC MYA-4574 / FGSC 10173) TaxID=321614 RepID=Q0UYP5_PHANO|nr:hypothetical protein SNOG_03119 [Parastagonospora nodorum SN15]KAH3919925.1 hypothetical protein HBH56_020520 [Parastagonospora nodorum]EAT89850.1 hypothetical protein SNOG_03119 [Parastagonospora nodorum SN15]KAH3937322.1 hypothetical protein HBH54_013990 [Parastagonospora nodorum]KAH3967633.1 hypothetical protein HBH51_137710 [Parastagonospora nodorum]KAH3990071.1 hypothetical protein HBH52_002930 [Parastagonospora nodorum]
MNRENSHVRLEHSKLRCVCKLTDFIPTGLPLSQSIDELAKSRYRDAAVTGVYTGGTTWRRGEVDYSM